MVWIQAVVEIILWAEADAGVAVPGAALKSAAEASAALKSAVAHKNAVAVKNGIKRDV